jgi:HEAT repeat protein
MPRKYSLVLICVFMFFHTSARAQDKDFSFNGRRVSEWILMLKEDQTARKRKAAAIALGQIVSENKTNADVVKAVLPALAKAVRSDPSPSVRGQAANIIGQQDADTGSQYVSDLAECVRTEKDPAAKIECAQALGRFGAKSRGAVIALTNALKDSDAAVKAAVADALGRIGPDSKAAAPDLIPLVKDTDKTVRRAAVFALGRIEPEDPSPVSVAFVELLKVDKDKDVRLETVVSIGLLGDRSDESVKALAKTMADPEAEIRKASAMAVAKLGKVARLADKELRKLATSDKDKETRMDAIHALGVAFAAEPAELIPFLSNRLKDDVDFEVRIAIADELGGMGAAAKDAIPALRLAQKDQQIKVRAAAAAAIKQIEKASKK